MAPMQVFIGTTAGWRSPVMRLSVRRAAVVLAAVEAPGNGSSTARVHRCRPGRRLHCLRAPLLMLLDARGALASMPGAACRMLSE